MFAREIFNITDGKLINECPICLKPMVEIKDYKSGKVFSKRCSEHENSNLIIMFSESNIESITITLKIDWKYSINIWGVFGTEIIYINKAEKFSSEPTYVYPKTFEEFEIKDYDEKFFKTFLSFK